MKGTDKQSETKIKEAEEKMIADLLLLSKIFY